MSPPGEGRPRGLLRLPEDLLGPSDLSRCLSALLWLLDWSGGADDLLAALPHAKPQIDLTDLRNTLAILGYPTRAERLRRGNLDPRRLPAILLTPGEAATVVYRDEDGRVLRFDGASGAVTPCAPEALRGTLLLIETNAAIPRQNWFRGIGSVSRLCPAMTVSNTVMVKAGTASPSTAIRPLMPSSAGRSRWKRRTMPRNQF